jgi:hypothetical protein
MRGENVSHFVVSVSLQSDLLANIDVPCEYPDVLSIHRLQLTLTVKMRTIPYFLLGGWVSTHRELIAQQVLTQRSAIH